jgi:putative phage-type endonuclease
MLTQEQLEMRKKAITGTDIARICGLSEFGSALDVFLEKTNRAEPLDITPAIKRGIHLEQGILNWYAEDTGALRVERCGTIQLAGQPRIMATPDGVAMFGDKSVPPEILRVLGKNLTLSADVYDVERRGVEVKAPGRFMEAGWGEPGTDQVPQAYLCQAVFEMAVLDCERLDFAALLGGELQVYPVKRNRKVEGLLIERALAFWRDHVEADKPPAPTWRERDQEWIQRTFPKATKPALRWDELAPEQRIHVQMYLEAHAEADAAVKRKLERELRVKMIVGEAGGIDGLPKFEGLERYTRIDWRENASGPVAWKQVAEALKSGASWEAALAANQGKAARPFVPRKSKKGDE